jgi:hypothetical protein
MVGNVGFSLLLSLFYFAFLLILIDSAPGFRCVKLDGRMTPALRATVIDAFTNQVLASCP